MKPLKENLGSYDQRFPAVAESLNVQNVIMKIITSNAKATHLREYETSAKYEIENIRMSLDAFGDLCNPRNFPLMHKSIIHPQAVS